MYKILLPHYSNFPNDCVSISNYSIGDYSYSDCTGREKKNVMLTQPALMFYHGTDIEWSLGFHSFA